MRTRMHKVFVNCVLLGLLVLVVSPLPVQAASSVQHTQTPDFAAIDTYVTSQMQEAQIPGLALGIVQGSQVVHLRGFGIADPSGRHVTSQTPFIIGSLSKSFTAMAIMQLVEAGKIDLDAPVQHYIPWFRVADAAASARITVRHLLNDTSGIPYVAGLAPLAGSGDATLEQRVRELNTVELTRPVGQTYQYSNVNYVVLGLIIQRVSGQSYGEYIQQHIFAQLEMRHSFVSQTEAMKDGMATGYRWWFGAQLPASLPYLYDQLPAGYLISSAEDMTHYLLANINNGYYGDISVLSPPGVAELHRPAVRSTNGYYGMGWDIGPINGVPTLSHGGDTPNFHANMIIIPGGQWGIVLLVNANNFIMAPTVLNQMKEGVISILMGLQPPGKLSFPLLYGSIDVFIFLISALQLWALVKLLWWRKRVAQLERSPWVLVRRVILPVTGDILVPFIVITGIPLAIGISWSVMALYQPDFIYWLIVMMILSLVEGITKVVLAILELGKTKAETPIANEMPSMV